MAMIRFCMPEACLRPGLPRPMRGFRVCSPFSRTKGAGSAGFHAGPTARHLPSFPWSLVEPVPLLPCRTNNWDKTTNKIIADTALTVFASGAFAEGVQAYNRTAMETLAEGDIEVVDIMMDAEATNAPTPTSRLAGTRPRPSSSRP